MHMINNIMGKNLEITEKLQKYIDNFSLKLHPVQQEIIDKKLLIIDGNDFSQLGESGKDIRVAIMERVLEYTSCIYVKE